MTTIFGLLLAAILIGVGMVLKGVSFASLLNPAAFLIIFGGTFASIIVAFPFSEIKRIPLLFKIAFIEPKLPSKVKLVEDFVTWSTIAREKGFLALEEIVDDVEDPFLRSGIELVLEGSDGEFIEEVLLEEVDALESRHKVGASIFVQAGTYAPTLGVLGAVIGLIAALSNLQDIDKLGESISAAFIATLLGIFSGYAMWHPIANNLKQISKKEQEIKLMMIEGILSIQEGASPKVIEKKLSAFLPQKMRNAKRGEKDETQTET